MSFLKYAIYTLFSYFFVFFMPIFFMNQPEKQIDATICAYLLGAMLMIILYRRQSPKLVFEQTNIQPNRIFLWGVLGIIFAIFTQNIAALIESLYLPPVASTNTAIIVELTKINPLFLFATAIGGPIMEEFVFRRTLIGLFQHVMPLFISGILSAALFAIAHQDGHLLIYFFMGLVFNQLYLRTGNIWTSIITHCGMNALVMLVQLSI